MGRERLATTILLISLVVMAESDSESAWIAAVLVSAINYCQPSMCCPSDGFGYNYDGHSTHDASWHSRTPGPEKKTKQKHHQQKTSPFPTLGPTP